MSFTESISFVLNHEGGYCNHPNDRGGETYKGIARKMHPSWLGWQYIDIAKGLCNPGTTRKSWAVFTKFVEEQYPDLQDLVLQFYRVDFWDTQRLDYIHEAIAHLMLDFGVNSGLSRACKHLQKALLASGVQVVVDGKLGDQTLGAIQTVDPQNLALTMLDDRQAFYNALVMKDPSQSQFINGWTNRVEENRSFILNTFFS